MRIIKFKDHGQDLLTWVIDDNGRIVECKPFQFPFFEQMGGEKQKVYS